MSKFKVGDVVKVVCTDHFQYRRGQFFVVAKVDPDGDIYDAQGICICVRNNPTRVKIMSRTSVKAAKQAERKAKADRAKLLRELSPAGRRVVAMLSASEAAFGCQRDAAIKLTAAITGDDPAKLARAIQ